ncbi:hypothetical protein BDP55DRAFT_681391 [Colletotrichum godetiae]|uniref:Secreted protein n=1 Tax=Colletotrichum godetiae TaxID=1209918 RepID=A0AAJ0A940_9PEZI|nr:uncharacterized protein BDP55DRAFT_681391 [Colletotrichum godetiae]KAK1658809.1 hypothetical protein BDP55DRAFT_681391 [Colletotrichum godetiae]
MACVGGLARLWLVFGLRQVLAPDYHGNRRRHAAFAVLAHEHEILLCRTLIEGHLSTPQSPARQVRGVSRDVKGLQDLFRDVSAQDSGCLPPTSTSQSESSMCPP